MGMEKRTSKGVTPNCIAAYTESGTTQGLR